MGTVIIHQHGADVEASEMFWKSLQFYGKPLLTRIAELECENNQLRSVVDALHSNPN
jgi:hypothetical protein